MNLATPKNQTAEILYELLKNESINFKQTFENTGIINLSARISDLRHHYQLSIPCVEKEIKNKHGRKITFGVWNLVDKDKGRIIYTILNK